MFKSHIQQTNKARSAKKKECRGWDLNPGDRLERAAYLTGLYDRGVIREDYKSFKNISLEVLSN